MTEQEIINYLKENKSKGIAFAFMPEEVQKWAKENSRELCCYNQPIESTEYEWMRDGSYKQINQDGLYALPDEFEEKKPSGWVEFEINERGQFIVNLKTRYYLNWFEWWRLLEKSMDYNYCFTAFGGWQYKDSFIWTTEPQVQVGRGNNYSSCYCEKEQGEDYTVKPAIPVKIRFWKGEIK